MKDDQTPVAFVLAIEDCFSLSTGPQIPDSLKEMNANILTVDDAALCLAEVVDHVHASGEPTVLIKSGKPVAKIVRVTEPGSGSDRLIAFLRQWRMAHPEPDDQLGEVIAESRRSVQPPRDPWE